MEREYWVYMLQCGDGSLYAGWTTDPEKRLRCHQSGKGAKYTRSRLPVKLAYLERCADESGARKRECELKKLSRHQKLLLSEMWEEEKDDAQLQE